MNIIRWTAGGFGAPLARAALRGLSALVVWAGGPAGLAGGLSGCARVENPPEPIVAIAPREEPKVGELIQEEIARQFQLVTDDELLGYVRGVGARIVAASAEKSEARPEFFIVNDPSPNAFTILGGGVYIHTGLLYSAQNEAELAGVLAHAYGHIVYRHDTTQLSETSGPGLIERLVAGDRSPRTQQSVAVIVGNLGRANYTAVDELEADQVAVPAMAKAGYAPAGLVSLFQTLRSRGADADGPSSFFGAHPVTQERVNRIRTYVGSLSGSELARPAADLRRAQERIDQLGLAKRGPDR